MYPTSASDCQPRESLPPGLSSIAIVLLHTHVHIYPPSISRSKHSEKVVLAHFTGHRVTAFRIRQPTAQQSSDIHLQRVSTFSAPK
jgi:hypothetical protein